MLRLLSCGCKFVHGNGIEINRPEGAGNYAFVFFRSPGEALLEGEVRQVPANCYILFRPDTPQRYGNTGAIFINDWFHCEGEETTEFFARLHFPLDTVVEAPDPMMISRAVLELSGTLRQGGCLREEILDSDLRSFFLKLCDTAGHLRPGDKSWRHFRRFTALRNQLFASPQERRRVGELAAAVNMSRSYFQHIYKELFGVPVMADIIASRLEYAKYLLRSGSFSVGEVATQCGYENDVHFIRQFKKMVGVPPGRYSAGASAGKGEPPSSTKL